MSMIRARWLLRVFLCLILLLTATPATSLAAPDPLLSKKVIVVLANGLRLSDLSEQGTPNLWTMGERGALGVMNHHTTGVKNDVNLYLSLGEGAKAGVTPDLDTVAAYDAREAVREHAHVTGRQLYVRNMGVEPDGRIVVPELPLLKKQDEKKRSSATPGLLGDAVHDLGGVTAVIGNSDLGGTLHRPAALVAMNSWGIVDKGDVHAGAHQDLTRPYGLYNDAKGLFEQYRALGAANLVVIETGDLTRWQRLYPLMEPSQQTRMFQEALGAVDQLVGMLLPDVDANTMLAVVSPTKHPAADAPPLSPVLLAGGDVTPQGVLTSSTTKRDGLIANYDLAPTFVKYLGGDPTRYPFLGQPASIKPAGKVSEEGSSYAVLTNIVDGMMVPSKSRNVLVRYWSDAWIGLAAVMAVALWLRKSWSGLLRPATEILLIFPLAWLYVPLFAPASVATTVIFSLLVTGAIWMLLQLIRERMTRLGWLAGLTVLTLLVDVMIGSPLIKQSVLSYDPTVGARYYGIGNEYMGILLGSLLLLTTVLTGSRGTWRVKERLGMLAFFVFVTYLFAAPALGTNAGGALAAAVGFSYAFLQVTGLANLRMRWKLWLWLGGAFLGVLAGMVVINVALPSGEQTHIGRAAGLLLSGQWTEVANIALRKFELNLRLLRVSAWGKLLLISFVVLTLWRMRQPRPAQAQANTTEVNESDQTRFLLQRNCSLLLVTAAAAFLFNDSGVVAAALILLYALVPLTEQWLPAGKFVRNTSLPLDILPTETAPQE